jgi:chorismate mutase
MNIYFLKFLQRNLPYFLCIFLCAQCLPVQLPAGTIAHQSMEEYAVEKHIDQLLLLIQKRLAIMHEVARTKWVQRLPIEDKEREQQVLKVLVEQASRSGLDEKWVERFFQAQMDAAKEVQKQDFAVWEQHGALFEKVFSLKDDLRIYIDQINLEMIDLLIKISGQCKHCESYLSEHPISIRPSDAIEESVWQMAISPLRAGAQAQAEAQVRATAGS